MCPSHPFTGSSAGGESGQVADRDDRDPRLGDLCADVAGEQGDHWDAQRAGEWRFARNVGHLHGRLSGQTLFRARDRPLSTVQVLARALAGRLQPGRLNDGCDSVSFVRCASGQGILPHFRLRPTRARHTLHLEPVSTYYAPVALIIMISRGLRLQLAIFVCSKFISTVDRLGLDMVDRAVFVQ